MLALQPGQCKKCQKIALHYVLHIFVMLNTYKCNNTCLSTSTPNYRLIWLVNRTKGLHFTVLYDWFSEERKWAVCKKVWLCLSTGQPWPLQMILLAYLWWNSSVRNWKVRMWFWFPQLMNQAEIPIRCWGSRPRRKWSNLLKDVVVIFLESKSFASTAVGWSVAAQT